MKSGTDDEAIAQRSNPGTTIVPAETAAGCRRILATGRNAMGPAQSAPRWAHAPSVTPSPGDLPAFRWIHDQRSVPA